MNVDLITKSQVKKITTDILKPIYNIFDKRISMLEDKIRNLEYTIASLEVMIEKHYREK